jgi:hypothetical protein
VAEIFEVPLRLPDGWHEPPAHVLRPAGAGEGRRSFYAMPYERFFIWGATAGMLRNLFHFLRAHKRRCARSYDSLRPDFRSGRRWWSIASRVLCAIVAGNEVWQQIIKDVNDFFSILCALLIEQLKPLRADNQIYAEIKRWPCASKPGSMPAR